MSKGERESERDRRGERERVREIEGVREQGGSTGDAAQVVRGQCTVSNDLTAISFQSVLIIKLMKITAEN